MTEKNIKLSVYYENGVGFLNKIKFTENVESPEALVNIQNYYAIATTINFHTF